LKNKKQLPNIYKLTLLKDINTHKKGEIYIGKTNGRNLKYWSSGKVPILIAKKYGKSIFRRDIIISGNFNESLLNDLEVHYIRLYGTQIKGLNIQPGGSKSRLGRCVHEYDSDGNYVTTYLNSNHASITIGCSASSIRHACKSLTTLRNGKQYRYFKSDIIEKTKPRNVKRIPIYQYTFCGDYVKEYDHAKSVCDELGGSITEVHAACNVKNPNKSFRGFLWSYNKKDKIEPYTHNLKRNIHQYDEDGNYITTFDCATSAAKALGKIKGKCSINSAVDKNRWLSYGFQWRSYKIQNCGKYIPYSMSKKVICMDLNDTIIGEFNSIKEASNIMKVSYSEIGMVLNKKKEKAKGYKWKIIQS